LASRAPELRWLIFGLGRLSGNFYSQSGPMPPAMGTPLSVAYTQKMARVFDVPGGGMLFGHSDHEEPKNKAAPGPP